MPERRAAPACALGAVSRRRAARTCGPRGSSPGSTTPDDHEVVAGHVVGREHAPERGEHLAAVVPGRSPVAGERQDEHVARPGPPAAASAAPRPASAGRVAARAQRSADPPGQVGQHHDREQHQCRTPGPAAAARCANPTQQHLARPRADQQRQQRGAQRQEPALSRSSPAPGSAPGQPSRPRPGAAAGSTASAEPDHPAGEQRRATVPPRQLRHQGRAPSAGQQHQSGEGHPGQGSPPGRPARPRCSRCRRAPSAASSGGQPDPPPAARRRDASGRGGRARVQQPGDQPGCVGGDARREQQQVVGATVRGASRAGGPRRRAPRRAWPGRRWAEAAQGQPDAPPHPS